jgi:pantothenate synthetase
LIFGGERNTGGVKKAMEVMIRTESSATIDYLSIADAVTLEEQTALHRGQVLLISLAARFGTTRLIDNLRVVVP